MRAPGSNFPDDNLINLEGLEATPQRAREQYTAQQEAKEERDRERREREAMEAQIRKREAELAEVRRGGGPGTGIQVEVEISCTIETVADICYQTVAKLTKTGLYLP